MIEPMRILVAYDGSKCADVALKGLKAAGLPEKAEVMVMSIADVFIPPLITKEETFPPHEPEVIHRAHKLAEEKLRTANLMAKRARDQISGISLLAD